MNRKEFIRKSCSCTVLTMAGAGLINFYLMNKAVAGGEQAADVNMCKIMGLLRYVDSDSDESMREKIFGRLGYECFHCTYAERWAGSLTLESLLEYVNKGKSSRWERLEYSDEASAIKIIGREAPCVCSYAQDNDPPGSLCTYCCREFLKEFFGTLLKKNVGVTVDGTVLQGKSRCCATISMK